MLSGAGVSGQHGGGQEAVISDRGLSCGGCLLEGGRWVPGRTAVPSSAQRAGGPERDGLPCRLRAASVGPAIAVLRPTAEGRGYPGTGSGRSPEEARLSGRCAGRRRRTRPEGWHSGLLLAWACRWRSRHSFVLDFAVSPSRGQTRPFAPWLWQALWCRVRSVRRKKRFWQLVASQAWGLFLLWTTR